ncbi:twin-arginine translocase subunit TatC [Corynebacterium sp. MSK204]|uniref:twin-arginine translocase subunit TatC n=1 Tax=Corynebacterium sp. MSK204 TaxID=3050217 RepID=UPI00254DD259|nr:twin-arginine translocase subunit TatC [Corynebacterium sp. MSK204]MDK8659224.1 twin-arginine translocase subunit TatC [Corynebacterium sp. MSK204]
MSSQTHPVGEQGSRVRRKRRGFSRKPKNPTGEMTLVQHLQELRRRIIISLLALVIGAIIGFIWYQQAPFRIPPLGEILREPYCSLPEDKRANFNNDGECRLLATSPFEMLILRLKVGALAGTVISSPVWLYQVWAFIVPGLHKNERRYTLSFVVVAVSLFLAGAILAYFILSVGLEFLIGIGAEYQTAALTGERYFYFLLALLLIFGISFEIPLLIVSLNLIGVLEYNHVKDKRRIVIVVVMIFAAFVTPGQDPFTMVVLSASLMLLIEIAFQFCRIHDKRQNRQRPDWMDLDDESASALDESPTGVGGPAPVDAPSSVSSSGVYASPKPAAASASSQTVRTENRTSDSTSQRAEDRKGPQRPNDEGGFFDDVL